MLFEPVTNFTPHKPLLKIVKIEDDPNYWNSDITDHVKKIFSVYVYDHRRKIHVCSITPSAELHFIRYDWQWKGDPNEETRERVYDLIDSVQLESVIYMDFYDVEKAPVIEEGALPDGKTGAYKIYNAHSFEPEKRAAEDQADAEYEEKTAGEWGHTLPLDEKTEKAISAWEEAGDKATAEAIEEALEYGKCNHV